MTRGALHPHRMQSIPPLTSHRENLVNPGIIICRYNSLHLMEKEYNAFHLGRIEEIYTVSEYIYEMGPYERVRFVRAMGDM